MMRLQAFIICLTIFAAATLSFGQTMDANLVGSIVDSSGGGIPNANVEITNQATGVKGTTKTEANGQYRFNNLPIVSYDITAAAAGVPLPASREFSSS